VANEMSVAGVEGAGTRPITIRNIGPADLIDALAKGFDDFKYKPSHIPFLILIYPILCFFLIRFTAGYAVLPLIFPLIAGYTLIGPVTAVGLYEMSRRRELGLDVSWRHAFAVVRLPSIRAIAQLSSMLMALFAAWLLAALWIYDLTFGSAVQPSIADFARQVFTTRGGWALVVVGCGVGFCFAVVALAVGVVSFPLLVDHDVDAVTAIQTSVRAVLANPMTMAMWGFVVAGALLIGSLPFFIGLAVVWPVLGHSTWHLYRKVVEH